MYIFDYYFDDGVDAVVAGAAAVMGLKVVGINQPDPVMVNVVAVKPRNRNYCSFC